MTTSKDGGGYRLPRAVEVRLAAAAKDLRNCDAVMRLAAFLGRFHTAPAVLGRAFPVDRLALADHDGHGLTEARVRGALAALEAVGFLVREAVKGSAYRPTQQGLRRKPVFFRIAAEFASMFEKSNTAALRARRADSTDRRPVTPSPTPRTPTLSRPTAKPVAYSPKESPRIGKVSLGEQNLTIPEPGLEAALSRLKIAIQRGAA